VWRFLAVSDLEMRSLAAGETNTSPRYSTHMFSRANKALIGGHGAEGSDALQIMIDTLIVVFQGRDAKGDENFVSRCPADL
jgi:hypothetical protein